jgi:hypothetical protein
MHLEHFLKTGVPRSRSLCFFAQCLHTRSPPFSARALSPPGCGGSYLRTSSPPEATGLNWRPFPGELAPGSAAPDSDPGPAPSVAVPLEPMLGLIPGSVRMPVFLLPRLLVRAPLLPPLMLFPLLPRVLVSFPLSSHVFSSFPFRLVPFPLLQCVLVSFALSPRVSILFPFGEPGCCSMWSQLRCSQLLLS